MTGLDDDRELDDFLARRSVVHRRLADRDRTDPPPELDRLVLDKAREAIAAPANTPVYRAPRWALPVSLAATLVLAFAIVLNMGRLPGGETSLTAQAPAEADAAATAALADNAAERQLKEDFAFEQGAATRSRANTGAGLTHEELPAAEPPALASRDVAAREQARTADVALANARTAATAAVEMPSAVTEASGAANIGAVSAAPASPPLAAAAKDRRYVLQPAETRAIVPAKSEMAVSSGATDSVVVSGARAARKDLSADSPMPIAASGAAAAPMQPGAGPLSEEAKRANPEAWRREIEALRIAGKTAEADRELMEFRKYFPAEAAKLAPSDPRPAQ